ncbi:MAG TPA: TatD family hydrolase [Armatimonadaceae bacterium]|nr:TatD family hydrolase [Armatimonadaceae bacterium]
MLIDTHVHFNHESLGAADALPGVLARAEAAGVSRFVVVGFDAASSERAVELARQDERIYATVGVHPHDAAHYDPATESRLRAWCDDPRVVAIGEIGLDFYRDLSPRDAQFRAFRGQLEIARQVGLPVVIHCRDAYPETMDLLEAEAGDLSIVLHCFAGEMEHARRAWARGWYLGVDGPITYRKNDALRAVFREAPAGSILLETDAPYLSPEPMRGKFPNEPSRLEYVARAVAAQRGEAYEVLVRQTTENAYRAFPRLTTPPEEVSGEVPTSRRT